MYNRTKVKLEAKQSLNAHFGLAVGAIIVAGLILAVSGYVPLATLILMGVISVGLATVMLAIVRDAPVEFSDLFKGFSNFGTNCLAGILVSVFTFLWSLLFVIPGIIKGYSYSMTYYILADHPEMSPKDAIAASCQLMDGHKFDLFVLQLSFFWWHLLGSVTFGLAYIYVGPYIATATAKFYEAIKSEKYGNTAPVQDAQV